MTTIRTLDDLEGQPHASVFPESEPRTVRLRLEAGESVPAHAHPDREVVVYLVDGSLEIGLGDDTYDLAAGDVARFDGDQEIAPRALEPSTALIVLAKRTGD